MACLRRGGWMEVTMISRGVGISIAGGVAETEHVDFGLCILSTIEFVDD